MPATCHTYDPVANGLWAIDISVARIDGALEKIITAQSTSVNELRAIRKAIDLLRLLAIEAVEDVARHPDGRALKEGHCDSLR